MRGCQFCGFLSDPSTGNIFDEAYPCPKCRKKAVKRAIPKPMPRPTPMAGFNDPMSVGSNIIAVAKLAGLGASFFYLRKKLGELESNEATRRKLGPRLASFKKASLYIPAFGAPYLVELVSKEEWPLLGTLFQVGMSGLAVKTALESQN